MKKRDEGKIVNYIYNLMSEQERKAFQKLMKNDKDLAREVKSYMKVRKDMSSWKAPENKNRIVDSVHIYNSANSGVLNLWKRLPSFAKAAGVVAVLFFLLSISNFSIMVNSDGFHARFGLIPQSVPAQAALSLDDNKREIMQMVNSHLDRRENEQIKKISYLLSDNEGRLNMQRRLELEAVYSDLEGFRMNTRARFLNTNRALNGIADYISHKNQPRAKYANGSY